MQECGWVTQNTGKEKNYLIIHTPCKGGKWFLSFLYFSSQEILTGGQGKGGRGLGKHRGPQGPACAGTGGESKGSLPHPPCLPLCRAWVRAEGGWVATGLSGEALWRCCWVLLALIPPLPPPCSRRRWQRDPAKLTLKKWHLGGSRCGAVGLAAAWECWDEGSIPGLAQWIRRCCRLVCSCSADLIPGPGIPHAEG